MAVRTIQNAEQETTSLLTFFLMYQVEDTHLYGSGQLRWCVERIYASGSSILVIHFCFRPSADTIRVNDNQSLPVSLPILKPYLRLSLLHAQKLTDLSPASSGWAPINKKQSLELNQLLRRDPASFPLFFERSGHR